MVYVQVYMNCGYKCEDVSENVHYHSYIDQGG